MGSENVLGIKPDIRFLKRKNIIFLKKYRTVLLFDVMSENICLVLYIFA